MNVERTYRWTRMLHSGVQFSSTAALPPTQFLADCIINIGEFEFSTGTGIFVIGYTRHTIRLLLILPKKSRL